MWAYPSDSASDNSGNVLIPFAYTATDIPFGRWQMVSKKVFQADSPVVIQSIIVTHKGEVFVQYAQEVNDESEYPSESVTETEIVEGKVVSTGYPNGNPLTCSKGHPMTEHGFHVRESDAIKEH